MSFFNCVVQVQKWGAGRNFSKLVLCSELKFKMILFTFKIALEEVKVILDENCFGEFIDMFTSRGST